MPSKSQPISTLKKLRKAAGVSQHELARLVNERQSNIAYWENNNKLPRADLLIPIAEALDCSIEELLGSSNKPNQKARSSKMKQLFDSASELPRRQQDKIVSILEPFIKEHSSN